MKMLNLNTTKVPVEVSLVSALCPCGGNLQFTGQKATTIDNGFIHKCQKCNQEAVLEQPFPNIAYDPKQSVALVKPGSQC